MFCFSFFFFFFCTYVLFIWHFPTEALLMMRPSITEICSVRTGKSKRVRPSVRPQYLPKIHQTVPHIGGFSDIFMAWAMESARQRGTNQTEKTRFLSTDACPESEHTAYVEEKPPHGRSSNFLPVDGIGSKISS